jgi:hypothetical protein
MKFLRKVEGGSVICFSSTENPQFLRVDAILEAVSYFEKL